MLRWSAIFLTWISLHLQPRAPGQPDLGHLVSIVVLLASSTKLCTLLLTLCAIRHGTDWDTFPFSLLRQSMQVVIVYMRNLANPKSDKKKDNKSTWTKCRIFLDKYPFNAGCPKRGNPPQILQAKNLQFSKSRAASQICQATNSSTTLTHWGNSSDMTDGGGCVLSGGWACRCQKMQICRKVLLHTNPGKHLELECAIKQTKIDTHGKYMWRNQQRYEWSSQLQDWMI